MTRRKRDAIEADIPKGKWDSHPLTRRTAIREVTYVCLALLCGFVITAWVLFFLGLAS